MRSPMNTGPSSQIAVNSAAEVASEAKAVAQDGGRMAAVKNALQTDVGQVLKRRAKTSALISADCRGR